MGTTTAAHTDFRATRPTRRCSEELPCCDHPASPLFPDIMPAETECPDCPACESAEPRTLLCEDAGREKVLVKAASPICCTLCPAEAFGCQAVAFGFNPGEGELRASVFFSRGAAGEVQAGDGGARCLSPARALSMLTG